MQQTSQATNYTRRSLAEKSLADLSVLVQQGHLEAFGHIIERCNQRLFRIARAVLNDESQAEDVLQDAYIKAFQHMDTYHGDAQLTTWLTRIVLNECYRHLRSKRPTVDIDRVEAAQAQSRVIDLPTRYGMADPAHSTARLQVRELIEKAISDLPEAFRVVFMLREVEGCSTAETAALLGVRAATVKTRLFRARRQLRKALHEKLSPSLHEAFPFLGQRCARLTNTVMLRLANIPNTNTTD